MPHAMSACERCIAPMPKTTSAWTGRLSPTRSTSSSPGRDRPAACPYARIDRQTIRAVSDLEIVIRAAAFAAHKHRDQRRKDVGATPYINHPLGLARILTAEGGVTDVATIC